jgi:hypothetical protein
MSISYPPTPNQPTLPPEGNFTEAELVFMDESPPGLFPENQDSNFGFILRKIFSDLAQDVADWQDILYNEHFVSTATRSLPQWEIEYGLPPVGAGATIEFQRANVVARVQRGPFTRARRDNIIRTFVQTTFGTPIQLVPQGVALDLGGIPIYGESADVSSLFMVVENIPGYSYLVWIAATNTPNLVALNRELKRITPAGISFTITNVHP